MKMYLNCILCITFDEAAAEDAIYSAGRVLGGGFIERDTKDTI